MKPHYLLVALPLVGCANTEIAKLPNVIIILSDDQGYQDLSCYGSPDIKTPFIDKMASEGLRLTEFYQAASVSSASRAAILTGRFNTKNRVEHVYFPNENGLPEEEVTLAEALKEQGYATACFGKWHLGDAAEHMPLNNGFDEYFGIPYSNDMYISPLIPISKDVIYREGYNLEKAQAMQEIAKKGRSVSIKSGIRNTPPLIEGGEVIEFPCNQSTLTRRYFDRAIDYVTKRCEDKQPFFIYLTPAMPHVPLHASSQFLGSSERGLYGDCVEEIDWNIGRLMESLASQGLDENTIVIFMSDNGPCLAQGENGGSADPLRDGKFSQYEGGVRVPFIIRWPGVVPAGEVSDGVIRSIDLFPTIMHYAGVDKLSHEVDGENIADFFTSPEEHAAQHDEYIYIRRGKVHGVRKGDWVYLPTSGAYAKKSKKEPELFNVHEDIAQSENLISKYPEKLEEMKALFERAKSRAAAN